MHTLLVALSSLLTALRRRIGDRPTHPHIGSVLPELAVLFCLLTLLWTSVTIALSHEYSATETAAEQSADNLARAFEESTRRTISEIDQILLSARAFYSVAGDRFNFNEWARNQILPDKMTAAIGMADRTGRVFADTLPFLPNVSIADRPHFRAQLDPKHDRLFISRPVHGRVSHQDAIQFTRKLLERDGKFAGVTVVSLGCDQLSRFYQTLDLGRGSVSLLSAEGVVLARGPFLSGVIGSSIKETPGLESVLTRRGGVVSFTDKWMGVRQIASFRRLEEYPLIVMVSLDANTAFQRYWSLRRRLLLSGVVATVVIGLIGGLWVKLKRRTGASQRALTITLGTISQGVLMLDAHGYARVMNPRALDLLGLPNEISPDVRRRAAQLAIELTESGAVSSTRVLNGCFEAHRDGKVIEVRKHALAGGGSVHTYTDVTEQRLADARIRHLAHHDALTGLANRVLLRQRLQEFIGYDKYKQMSTAFMIIDLDGFKGVNDTLGHDTGDQLLILVARRLERLVGETGFVARLGGDEFVIVQRLGQPKEAGVFAEQVLQRLAEPADVARQQLRIGASMGIAFHPRDAQDCDALLKYADIALYSAKASGRGIFRCFDKQMIMAVNERHVLERDLRRALDSNELEVHFQPEFSCTSLRIKGFEALARWRHPERGYISPEIFIRIAEQCGFIKRLGCWVLEESCLAAVAWQPLQRIAVNVSPMQLREEGFQGDVAAILARTGFPAELLEIEVTESVMADDSECTLETLHALKAMGICITLDDFGTGYSSLSHLRRFPFDRIKIDKSFVQGQASDPGVRVILEAILTMCHNLGLAVVGEGVETRQQLLMLQKRGCTEVQGFLLGQPMQTVLVEEFLKGRSYGLSAASGAVVTREDLPLAS